VTPHGLGRLGDLDQHQWHALSRRFIALDQAQDAVAHLVQLTKGLDGQRNGGRGRGRIEPDFHFLRHDRTRSQASRGAAGQRFLARFAVSDTP
jgi:hypothetical protein